MSAPLSGQLGDYRILEPIGAGGMGEVHLAEHVHLRKRYAVKVLPRTLAGDQNFVHRFHDEARVMADLRHPHIVQVHTMGQADGVYFLVMDYVTGPDGKPESLHDRLKDERHAPGGRLPEADVRRWAIQVAEALAYAHERGVVHRDLKPANILLDKNGDAVLTDFGLAKAIGREFILSQIHQTIQHSLGSLATLKGSAAPVGDTLDVAATIKDGDSGGSPGAAGSGKRSSGASSILGTYDYMAPEQRGEGTGEIDPRTDLYAFGIVLYRLLTGERPVGFPPPPSVAVPGLSKSWDAIVARCMQSNPAQRYASANELLGALRAVGIRRRRGVLAGGLVVMVVAVAAGLWGSGVLNRHSAGPVSDGRETSAGASLEAQPSDPVEIVEAPAGASPKISVADVSSAKNAATKARQAAVVAGAETHAAELLAAADKLFEQGRAYDTLENFADAANQFQQSKEQFAEAESIANRITAEIAAFSKADDELKRTKAAADRVDARQWAPERYGQALKLEEQARDAADRVTSTNLLNQAAKRYQLAVTETEQQGEAIVAAARREADSARQAADTTDVQKYAADEFRAAENLVRQAQDAGSNFITAKEQYEQAKAKFAEAVRVAPERKKAEETAIAQRDAARQAAEAERAKIGAAERKHARDKVAEGDWAWSEAEKAGTDYARARKLYGDAQSAYANALENTRKIISQIEDYLEAARKITGDAGLRLGTKPSGSSSEAQRSAAERALVQVASALKLDPEHSAALELQRQLEDWKGLPPTLTLHCDDARKVPLELVLIPAGEFVMGSPASEAQRDSDEGPQRTVRISRPFYLARTEVTQAQWKAVMGADKNPSHFKGDTLPVEQVSWNDAQEYCRKLSAKASVTVRLPTEAEWEYACRAGSSGRYCFGDSDGNLGSYAWYSANSGGRTQPVGTKTANAWGLHDMHGNVWEWCQDVWHDNYQGAPTDGSAWTIGGNQSLRVLRGGSWNRNPWTCRSANRFRHTPDLRSNNYGFRVAVGTP